MSPAPRLACLLAILTVLAAVPIACGFPDYGGFQSTTTSASSSSGAGGATSTSTSGGAGPGGQGGATGGGGSGGCASNADCAGTPKTAVCDIAKHVCVECLPANDTCGLGLYCAPTESCAPGCKDDTDCNMVGGSGGLTCDKANHICLGCTTDDQCPPGLLCDVGSSTCIPGCTAAHACPTAQTCCTGSCADLTSDEGNCGTCGTPCAPAHATGECVNSSCTVVSCDTGFNDCDGTASNGCESDQSSDPNHCGGCATKCPTPANAAAACQGGLCTLGACNPNYGDCDGNAANGCEINLQTNTSNCGGCGLPCSNNHGTPACASGQCSITCDAGYKNCDSDVTNGCEVNTATNVNNCGSCNNICQPQGGTPACVNSSCTVSMCAAGKGDCDGNPSNGCETTTTSDPNNCSGCGLACFVAHGTPGCGASACYIAACDPGFEDCDGQYANGCETNTQTSTTSCGTCGNTCTNGHGTTSCQGGLCTPVCAAGYQDCDSNPDNGCEANLNADPTNCGVCGKICAFAHGSGSCQAGSCVLTGCNSGFADCNLNPADGCETAVNTVSNCGQCGISCTNANGSTTCSGGACVPSCTTNFGDCDSNPNNGCETNTSTSVTDCGGCNQACSAQNGTPSCVSGSCTISCNAPYKDCNNNARTDGCETNTNSDPNHCGTCSTVCSGSMPNCVGGSCSGTSCPSGTSDCNGNSGDACECQTPGCCGTGCQTKHNDGLGQNFYDCAALGTYNQTQGMEACTAFTGDASLCHAYGCKGAGSNAVVCSDAYGVACACWDYTGSSVGHVFNSGNPGVSNCFCPTTSNPTWN